MHILEYLNAASPLWIWTTTDDEWLEVSCGYNFVTNRFKCHWKLRDLPAGDGTSVMKWSINNAEHLPFNVLPLQIDIQLPLINRQCLPWV